MLRTLCVLCKPKPLSAPMISASLLRLDGWVRDGNRFDRIVRDFVFPDFTQAIEFMHSVAAECEALQHHPSWTNEYNHVKVQLTTHDANNAVTQKDIDLALQMNRIYREMQKTGNYPD